MNKIGTIDIIKAYLGTKELSADNAYIGELSLLNAPIIDDRFRLEAIEASHIQLASKSSGWGTFQYSLDDGQNWYDFTTQSDITLPAGGKAYFRAKQIGNSSNSNYTKFVMSGELAAKGNIMYLYDYETLPTTITWEYAFYGLFEQCTALTTAPELPATTLSFCAYQKMFSGCESLTTAPELPATTLTSNRCYQWMFEYCSSLTTAPELSATTLSERCYHQMFQYCTSLTTAPELPATTLKFECYRGMFVGCSSLTTAPELPATTLAEGCYRYMFSLCTSLTTAPELPATTLVSYSNNYMFNGCENLSYVKCLATNISASNSHTGWVTGVASNGTFVKNANMSGWPSGANGIPTGWTVINA